MVYASSLTLALRAGAANRRHAPAGSASRTDGRLRRLARVALWVISGFIIGSILLVALYRYVPPPGTPLMLLRRVEGYGIYKSCVRPDLREPGSWRNRERGYSILQSPRFRLERDHDGLESLSE
jgi:hypothetical protein